MAKKTKKPKKIKKIKKRKKTRKIIHRKIIRRKKVKRLKRKAAKKRIVKHKKRRPKRKPKRKQKKVRKARQRRGSPKAAKRAIGHSLEQLFESPTKVQVMKLFFRNPGDGFLLKEIKKRLRLNFLVIKREIKKLEKIGLLKAKQISARKQLFFVNPGFDFFNELRELILKPSPVSREKILKAVKGLGRIKLILLSGLFTGHNLSKADLLIVGDNINQRRLNTFIKNLESEAGADIRCVAMTSEEFNYRYDMYDRFVRDLVSDKCEFLVNKILPGV